MNNGKNVGASLPLPANKSLAVTLVWWIWRPAPVGRKRSIS